MKVPTFLLLKERKNRVASSTEFSRSEWLRPIPKNMLVNLDQHSISRVESKICMKTVIKLSTIWQRDYGKQPFLIGNSSN